MIALAMETAERHGRPTCSECTPQLKARRGCRRPGSDIKQNGSPFVYTSPMLQGEGWKRIYECPVGKVLREAPHVFDVVERGSMTESLNPDLFGKLPFYLQRAIRIVSSERARLQEIKMAEMRGRHDSAAGMAARRG